MCARRSLPGDMNFPTYRQAGLLIAAGHSLDDMMCQIYLERAGSAERPPDAGPLFVEGRRLLLALRQSRYPVYSGGRLGHGVRDQERHQDRRRLDRRWRDR